eukprot:m.136184 g.136184  ORF g.136184 m.136184 type:complete len:65 (-) comp13931_c0_seq7:1131-1325(-)
MVTSLAFGGALRFLAILNRDILTTSSVELLPRQYTRDATVILRLDAVLAAFAFESEDPLVFQLD